MTFAAAAAAVGSLASKAGSSISNGNGENWRNSAGNALSDFGDNAASFGASGGLLSGTRLGEMLGANLASNSLLGNVTNGLIGATSGDTESALQSGLGASKNLEQHGAGSAYNAGQLSLTPEFDSEGAGSLGQKTGQLTGNTLSGFGAGATQGMNNALTPDLENARPEHIGMGSVSSGMGAASGAYIPGSLSGNTPMGLLDVVDPFASEEKPDPEKMLALGSLGLGMMNKSPLPTPPHGSQPHLSAGGGAFSGMLDPISHKGIKALATKGKIKTYS